MAGRRPGKKSFTAALRVAIQQAGKDPEGTKLRDIAEKLVELAVDGDIQAIKEIGDRLDGKPIAMTADVTNRLEELDDGLIDTAIDVLKGQNSTSESVSDGETAPTKH